MDRNLRIRMLMEATDRVTRPLRDMANGGSRAAEALRGTREQMQHLQRSQASIASFRSLRAGLQSTTNELAQTRTRINELRTAIASTDAPSRTMVRDLARAESAAGRLAAQQRRQAAELRTTRAEMRTAGIGTRDLTRHEERLGRELEETTRRMAEQSRRVEQLAARQRRFSNARDSFSRTQGIAGNMVGSGTAAIGGAVALAAPLVASSRGAMDLEEGMAGVAKVTGMAQGPLGEMQEKLIALSTRIPMTAVELSEIAAAAGAAGVGMDKFGQPLPSQANDLVAFTDAAARMGIAFDMSAEDAGGTMAKWRQAFKMTQPEVEALGDRVNALTNKFGGNASSVAGIVTRIGPLGEVAGIAAPQVSALASALNSIGVEEEIAATGIKNTLLTLTKGTAAAKSQKEAFKALGLDAEKVAKAMQVNASGTIVDVLERVGRLKTDKQASTLSELFGTESVGAIAPLLTNLDGLKQRLGLVADSSQYAGSMTNEFLSRIGTTKGATDLALNGLQSVNLTLGQALLPTITEGAKWFAGMARRTREWAQANPALAKNAMFLVGGLALLFGIFGIGMIAIAGIMGPIAILNAGLIAMGAAGGIASIGLLPILGTVALVVAAIALLAGGAYLIYSNWGAITGFFSDLWGGVTATFSAASDTVTGIFSGMWSGVKAIFSMSLGDLLNGLASFIGRALGTLFRFGASAAGWLAGTLPGLLASGWNSAWGILTGAISASWTLLTTQLPAKLANSWALAWSAFKSAMRAAFITLPTMFFDFGAMIITGLFNGIKSAPGRLWNAGKALAGSLAGGFKAAAQIRSPSRVFMGLGGHVIGGLNKGLDDAGGEPVQRMARLTRNMAAALAFPAITAPAMPALAQPLPVTAPAIAARPPAERPDQVAPEVMQAPRTPLSLRMPAPIATAIELPRLPAITLPPLMLPRLPSLTLPAPALPRLPEASAPPPIVQRLVADAVDVRAAITTGERARDDMRQATDARPRAASSYAPAPVSVTNHITIQAPPGMDEAALARAVAAELDRRERQRAANARSTYRDDPDGADL